MDCKQIQKLIEPFDRNELSLRDEEIFVNHMIDCKECQEELEIFYIVQYGLTDDYSNLEYGLDEYKKLIKSYDFKGLVDKKLTNSKYSILTAKNTQHYIKIIFLVSQICIFFAIILYIYLLL